MSSSNNKRRLLMRNLFTANGGCGCSKTKSTTVVFEPIPKPKISIYQNTNPSSLNSSTTSVSDEEFTSTAISDTDTHHDHNNKNHSITPKPTSKLINSIAVKKDSKDPHRDFRHSMLQMIFEREIYTESDLQELLECFLRLNAPCHHKAIVEVFTQICNEAFPKKKFVAEPSRRNARECYLSHV